MAVARLPGEEGVIRNVLHHASRPDKAQRSRLAAAQAPSTTSPTVHAALQRAIAESFVAGFRVTMLVSAGLAVLGALVVALLVPSGHMRQPDGSKRRDDAGYRPTEAENQVAAQGLLNRIEQVRFYPQNGNKGGQDGTKHSSQSH